MNGRLDAAVSSDVVGYTTFTMEAGKWYQIGTPFVSLDDATPTINTVFTEGFGAGDTLSVYNSSTGMYAVYYWKTSANGWGNRYGSSLVNAEIPSGRAVFIHKSEASDVVLSGKVSVVTVEFGSDEGEIWEQIVNVYPEDTKLNDLVWTGMSSGDTLSVFNPETKLYTVYYWKTAANGWGNRYGSSLPDVTLPAGQAMFIHKASAGTGTCSIE